MIGAGVNAFLQYGHSKKPQSREAQVGKLPSLRARLVRTDYGSVLSLSPMRLKDVSDIWDSIAPRHSTNLVLSSATAPPDASGERMSLADLVDAARAVPLEIFDDEHVLLNDDALLVFRFLGLPPDTVIVRITGPVEASDSDAIDRGRQEGRSPLLAELRAEAVLSMPGERSLHLESRDELHALLMVAESFRHYVAALLHKPVSTITAPDPWMMQRLLSTDGIISVRPVETEVFSTSIDIGICTSDHDGPATCSLIYDVLGNSWHDEP